MSDRVRSYVFRGHIESFFPKASEYQSGLYARYVMTGNLCFYGYRNGGGRILVNIEEEPDDDDIVFPDEATSDDNSQADEEPDGAAGMPAPEVYQAVQRRGVCTLIIEDTGLLTLPHVGLNVNLVLHRGQPLKHLINAAGAAAADNSTNITLKYRDYEYRIQHVRMWRAPDELRHTHLTAACCDVDELMRVDRARYAASVTAAELGVSRNSTAAVDLRGGNNRMYVVADLGDKKVIEALQRERRPFTELGGLCARGDTSVTFTDTIIYAFRNYYALCQTARQHAMLVGTSVHKALCKLSVPASVAQYISVAELDAVYQYDAARARRQPWQVITFGARALLPEHLLSSRLLAWPGVEWYEAQSLAKNNRLARLIEDTLGELPDGVSAMQIVQLAYEMHRDQQNPPTWLRNDTIFDVARLLQWINKKHSKRAGDSNNDASGELLSCVVKFMLVTGVWAELPQQTRTRMRVLAQCKLDANGAIWLTTAREYALTRELARRLITLQPQLVCVEHTGVPISIDPDVLHIYCAFNVVGVVAGDGRLQKCVPLYSIIGRMAYDDNDDFFAIHMLAFRRVIIYDAHFLGRRTLLLLCGLLLRVQQCTGAANFAVEFYGVNVLHSVFTEMVASHCFTVRTESAQRALHAHGRAEFDKIFSDEQKRPLTMRLRDLCVQCIAAGEVVSARRGLEAAIGALPPADIRMNLFDKKLRRWILVTDNRIEVASMLRTARRLLQPVQSTDLRSVMLDRELALIDANPARIADLVFVVAPFVGYHNRALRVVQFMVLRTMPRDNTVLVEHAFSRILTDAAHPGAFAAVSLDCAQLYLELQSVPDQIDHRVCCNTWLPTVMSVARHRLELSSQSFVMAAAALPVPKQDHTIHTTVMFGAKYRFDDVYRVFAHACGTTFQRFTAHNLDRGVLAQALKRREPEPRTFFTDMLRMN